VPQRILIPCIALEVSPYTRFNRYVSIAKTTP
jgi:hypothetical protein